MHTSYHLGQGLEYKQACDGQEAVEVFSSHPPGYFELVMSILPTVESFTDAYANSGMLIFDRVVLVAVLTIVMQFFCWTCRCLGWMVG